MHERASVSMGAAVRLVAAAAAVGCSRAVVDEEARLLEASLRMCGPAPGFDGLARRQRVCGDRQASP